MSTNSSNTATFVKLEHHRKQDMLPDAKDAKNILADTMGFRPWGSNMFTDASSKETEGLQREIGLCVSPGFQNQNCQLSDSNDCSRRELRWSTHPGHLFLLQGVLTGFSPSLLGRVDRSNCLERVFIVAYLPGPARDIRNSSLFPTQRDLFSACQYKSLLLQTAETEADEEQLTKVESGPEVSEHRP